MENLVSSHIALLDRPPGDTTRGLVPLAAQSVSVMLDVSVTAPRRSDNKPGNGAAEIPE